MYDSKSIPRKLTINVDSRERDPFLFPDSINVWVPTQGTLTIKLPRQKVTLHQGDYSFAEFPDLVAGERKRGVSELVTNFASRDLSRQRRAFTKLSGGIRFPYLFIEGSVTDLWREINYRFPNTEPGLVLDRIIDEAIRHELNVWWLGHLTTHTARRYAGEAVVRVFVRHVLDELLGSPGHFLEKNHEIGVAPKP